MGAHTFIIIDGQNLPELTGNQADTLETEPLKRGEDFMYGLYITLGTGTWSAACSLKKPDGYLINLTTNVVEPIAPDIDHFIQLSASAVETATWPAAYMPGDVKLTDSSTGSVVYTATFVVNATAGSITP